MHFLGTDDKRRHNNEPGVFVIVFICINHQKYFIILYPTSIPVRFGWTREYNNCDGVFKSENINLLTKHLRTYVFDKFWRRKDIRIQYSWAWKGYLVDHEYERQFCLSSQQKSHGRFNKSEDTQKLNILFVWYDAWNQQAYKHRIICLRATLGCS